MEQDQGNCNGCKGCSAFKEIRCYSIDHQDIALIKCPCSSCMVKPMCNQSCEDYTIYWNNWKDHIRKMENGTITENTQRL